MAVERAFIVSIPSTGSYFPLVLEEEEIDFDSAYALSTWKPEQTSADLLPPVR
jgi:hypothetical protein